MHQLSGTQLLAGAAAVGEVSREKQPRARVGPLACGQDARDVARPELPGNRGRGPGASTASTAPEPAEPRCHADS